MGTKIKSLKYEGVYYYDLKNGDRTYYIRYATPDKKRKVVKIGSKSGGITEKYCFNRRAEIIGKFHRNEIVDKKFLGRKKADVVTFGMIAEKYYHFKKTTLRDSSYKNIYSLYNSNIKKYLEKINVEEINSSHIQEIIEIKKATLSQKTINNMVNQISTIYRYAKKNKLYSGTLPTEDIDKFKVNNNRIRYLEKDEIKKLLEYLQKLINQSHLPEYYYIFVLLSLTTGARVSSVVHIKVSDINLDSRIIELTDYKNTDTYKGFIKKEYVPILKEYISKYFNANFKSNQYIINMPENIIRTRHIQRRLLSILNFLFNRNEKNTLNRVVIHTLRHTFASHCVISGVEIFTVQKLLNHKDINQTMRYAKLNTKKRLLSIDKLNF